MSVVNIANSKDEYIPVNCVCTYGEHELNSESGMKAKYSQINMLPSDCLEVNSIVDINKTKQNNPKKKKRAGVQNLVFQGRASLPKARIISNESILKIKASGL